MAKKKNRITGGKTPQAPIEVLRNINLQEWIVVTVILSEAPAQEDKRGKASFLFSNAYHICRVLRSADPSIFEGKDQAERFADNPALWDKAFFEFAPDKRVTIAQLIANPSLWPDETGLICQWKRLKVGKGIDALYRSGRKIMSIQSKEYHLGRPVVETADDLNRVAHMIGEMWINENLLWPEPWRNILVKLQWKKILRSFEEATEAAKKAPPMQQPLLAVATIFQMFAEGDVFCIEDAQDWNEVVEICQSCTPSLIQKYLHELEQLGQLTEQEKQDYIAATIDTFRPEVYVIDASLYTVRPWKQRKRHK
jgi:hypothetical protein